jgi:hypothetical protein
MQAGFLQFGPRRTRHRHRKKRKEPNSVQVAAKELCAVLPANMCIEGASITPLIYAQMHRLLSEDIARKMLRGNINSDDLEQINEAVILSEALTMRCAKK